MKKAAPKKLARPKKTAPRKKKSKKKRRARGKTQNTATITFEPKGLGANSGGQSGDLQGLSHTAGADSESVDELLEEGNAFEAEVVQGVQNAPDADQGEIRTHEVQEDDVPEEYLKRGVVRLTFRDSPPGELFSFRFEDDDGLVGARHDGFGDGDQAFLLAEDAEARGLPFAGIEFGGGALRGAGAAGLNLRDLHVEFRAVAHAFFEEGEDRHARQFGEQAFEGNDVTREISLFRGAFEVFEFRGLVQSEFAHRGADNFREVRAAAYRRTSIVTAPSATMSAARTPGEI